MNTPAHLLLGAAALARGEKRGLIWAALVGALLPDLSLYMLAGAAIWLLGIPPRIVFDEFYFSQTWQTVFAIDNSFLVWGFLLALAVWQRLDWGIVLTGAALLHLALDLPLHHDDGRPHFWPITTWVFESPLSYWDRSRGAGWIAPVGAAAATVAAILLWLRRPGWLLSALILCLLLAELMVAQVWMFVFSGA
ncbi:cobalamin biosynthesis protein CobQ [Marimonas sp. MJW-29]|uniref:Cobalamin biosynthesis protein CobQ n=1 Tax=Sulfitobacter sediminis TaxID=3234186 RepID=A0ABV3RK62_9RHOB